MDAYGRLTGNPIGGEAPGGEPLLNRGQGQKRRRRQVQRVPGRKKSALDGAAENRNRDRSNSRGGGRASAEEVSSGV